MSLKKELFYDWLGGNEWIFRHVNAISNEWYDQAMVLISDTFATRNFPYFAGLMIICGVLDHAMRRIKKRGGAKQSLISWRSLFIVFVLSYAADTVAIKVSKDYFSYPRPYAALEAGSVHQLEIRPAGDDYHSFPSGHAAFVTLIVASMWPVLSLGLRFLGVFLIGLVCWSRMAVGVHFPVDLLGGFLIGFFLVVIIRAIVYSILRRWFGVRC